jgi:hypothetical protein
MRIDLKGNLSAQGTSFKAQGITFAHLPDGYLTVQK